MADAVSIQGTPSPEEVAYKLLYLVAWGENRDLEGWGKADRKWLLDTYAECLLAVKNPAARASRPEAAQSGVAAET